MSNANAIPSNALLSNALLKWIGLCKAAGGVTSGFDSVLGEVRCGKSKLVMISSDASDRTRKQLKDKCEFHGVKCVECGFTSDEIGHAIGRGGAVAISFGGKGCFNKIRDYYAQKEKNNQTE